jgi:hypothetical protein
MPALGPWEALACLGLLGLVLVLVLCFALLLRWMIRH